MTLLSFIFALIFGSNKQPSKHQEYMDESSIFKQKNNKCTIYKITRFKGSVSSQFQSLICHKSILQFIYHQIKDKVHNHHRSLGLLGLGLAWRKSWFFGIFKYTLRIGEQRKQKQQASNSNESSLPILSLFDQVITTSYTKIPTYKIYNNSVQFIT